ncbi:hypothetical protein GN244_ATG00895 [Phytophthora infestans]|uniref:Uncharacterized protein n=1 Tax=Phytophthora infestans TaxID=4787 RepID=A0A833X2C1_PHYIN|nr:hypothetical protein GN244_ATG00895 [Phytophthora infestans]KAF4130260.1 hypothetical protein GN958_ATG20675 [Phytophthora infestans]KAI9997522.1 hypothetical protein PInf_001432 [Phytophthora infestans]
MEQLVAATLGIAFAVIIALFAHSRWRSPSSTETDSSDDETSGPIGVNVVADHDEHDSLLPNLAGVLRSPWQSVSRKPKEQPKMTRLARKGSPSMSLPLRKKKKKPAEVPVKKIHVPYFFPLLDETAEWWQTQLPTMGEPQPTPEQEPETSRKSHPDEDEVLASNRSNGNTQDPSKNLVRADHSAEPKLANSAQG